MPTRALDFMELLFCQEILWKLWTWLSFLLEFQVWTHFNLCALSYFCNDGCDNLASTVGFSLLFTVLTDYDDGTCFCLCFSLFVLHLWKVAEFTHLAHFTFWSCFFSKFVFYYFNIFINSLLWLSFNLWRFSWEGPMAYWELH